MLTEEQAANAYADVTDGCRHSVLATRDTARTIQRVKPDPEVNPLAQLDYKEWATWDEHMPQPTLQQAHTCAR